jgi:hypothetical protein
MHLNPGRSHGIPGSLPTSNVRARSSHIQSTTLACPWHPPPAVLRGPYAVCRCSLRPCLPLAFPPVHPLLLTPLPRDGTITSDIPSGTTD